MITKEYKDFKTAIQKFTEITKNNTFQVILQSENICAELNGNYYEDNLLLVDKDDQIADDILKYHPLIFRNTNVFVIFNTLQQYNNEYIYKIFNIFFDSSNIKYIDSKDIINKVFIKENIIFSDIKENEICWFEL